MVLVSFVLVATPAATQSFEITPFSGWRFGGSVEDFRTGASVDIDDAQSYGLLVSVPIDLGRHVEVMYSNQETELRLALPFNGRQIFDLTIENWMLGVRQDFAEDETVTPFASGLIGVTDAGGRSGESESRRVASPWPLAAGSTSCLPTGT